MSTVQKFGGSSVGSAEAIQHAGDRIAEGREFTTLSAVVSAARPPDTKGTTNRLIELFHTARRREQVSQQVGELMQIHHDILKNLGLPTDPLREREEDLHSDLSSVDSQPNDVPLSRENAERLDRIQTWGERVMAQDIFVPHLNDRGILSRYVDAASLIRTNSTFGNATVDEATTYGQIQKELFSHHRQQSIPVVPGFYGSDDSGRIVAFSRGGSDYSATLLAAGRRADQVDICTDIEGIMRIGPDFMTEIPNDERFLSELSYWEMLVFARRGATVVHKDAVTPIMGNGSPGIPMRIVNTKTGESRTTVSERATHEPKAIGVKQNQSFLMIRDPRIEQAGVLQEITSLLASRQLSIDVLSSESPTIEMTVEGKIPRDVRSHLERLFRVCTIEDKTSTVVAVGHEIRRNPKAEEVLRDATREYRHTYTEGPDSMTVVVPEEETNILVEHLYGEILEPYARRDSQLAVAKRRT